MGHRRNFGLSARLLPRQTRASANAGAPFFTWKAAAKRMKDRLCEAKGSPAERVSERVDVVIEHAYRRVFFVHDWNIGTYARVKSRQIIGEK